MFGPPGPGRPERRKMKIQIKRDHLLDILASARKAVSRTPIDTLANGILLKAEGSQITAFATDLEIGIKSSTIANIIEPGEIGVPVKLLDIVRKITEPDLVLEVKDNKLVLKYGKSNAHLSTYDPKDFPVFPETVSSTFTMDAGELKKAIDAVVYAAAGKCEYRPVFEGLYFDAKDGQINFVGTDTHRLALKTISGAGVPDGGVIIPAKSLKQLSSFLSDGNVNIAIEENQAIFNYGNTVLMTRLISGEYINYRQVIREKHNTKVTVETERVLAALERAEVLTENNIINVHVVDRLVLSVQTERGKLNEEIPAEVEGDRLKIKVNIAYLIEALKRFTGKVTLGMAGELSPIFLWNDNSYFSVVLPIR